jgi:hypothetical protein
MTCRWLINPITNPNPVYESLKHVRTSTISQTGSGAHPAYPIDTRDSLFGGKAQRREAGHSSPTGAEVKKTWIYIYIYSPIRVHMA